MNCITYNIYKNPNYRQQQKENKTNGELRYRQSMGAKKGMGLDPFIALIKFYFSWKSLL